METLRMSRYVHGKDIWDIVPLGEHPIIGSDAEAPSGPGQGTFGMIDRPRGLLDTAIGRTRFVWHKEPGL